MLGFAKSGHNHFLLLFKYLIVLKYMEIWSIWFADKHVGIGVLLVFLFCRIEKIESLEPFRCTERKQIILEDNDAAKMKLILWGEQTLLANIFRFIPLYIRTKKGQIFIQTTVS